SVVADAVGYWQAVAQTQVSGGRPALLEIPMVKICTGTIKATVVNDATQLPVPGATISVPVVDIGNGTTTVTGTAGPDGKLELDGLPLGPNNSSNQYFLRAFGPPPDNAQPGPGVLVPQKKCGDIDTATVTVHLPVDRQGSLTGE